MKNPWEWQEEDLLSLIQQQRMESVDLDYKACGALIGKDQSKPGGKDEISKDVVAFSNSTGGTLLYGIKENDQHLPVDLDNGFDPIEFSEERLEQMINSRVQPRIDGLRINRIPLKTRPGKVAYAVYVPQGKTAHQSWDKRYYKRFNFQSVPMEDYEIKDVNRRIIAPNLKLLWKKVEAIQATNRFMHSVETKLNARIVNSALTPAEHVLILIFLDSKIKVISHEEMEHVGQTEISIDGEMKMLNIYSYIWAIQSGHKLPIFQSAPPITVLNRGIRIGLPKNENRFVIGWDLRSPGMSPAAQLSYLSLTEGELSIEEIERLFTLNLM